MRKDWEVKKLGDVCEIERGGSPRPISSYITNDIDGINWIKIGDASDGSKYISSTKEKIKSEGVRKSRMVYKGDFILSNSMSFGKPYILDIDGCIHDGWLVIRDINNLFEKSFLYYYLSSPKIYREFKKMAVGGVVSNLNTSLVKGLYILIPPFQIQQQIVEELDCLTSIIEKQKKQLEELDNLAQSIFYDMFGDPNTNPKGMKMNKVSDLTVKMLTGPFGSMLHKSDYTADGIPSINPQNINKRKIITKDIARVSYQKAEELSKYIVRSNNIIVARRGDLKKCAIVTDKEDGWLCGTGSFMLELNKDIFPILFYYQYTSQSIQKYLNDKCIGATLPNLNQKILGDLKIIVPPFELQQQFAAKIEAIEKQKELVKKSIKETEDLFNSRMDYYFN